MNSNNVADLNDFFYGDEAFSDPEELQEFQIELIKKHRDIGYHMAFSSFLTKIDEADGVKDGVIFVYGLEQFTDWENENKNLRDQALGQTYRKYELENR